MKSLREHKLVRTYLDQATVDIRDKQLKADIQDELFSHIESEVERMQSSQSLSLDDAIKKAIDDLGSPKTICDSFFKLYHRSWRTFFKLAGIAASLVVVISAFYIFSLLRESQEKRERYVNSIRPYVDLYLNDVAEIEMFNAFPQANGTRDAGEFLNPRVGWAISDYNPHIVKYNQYSQWQERITLPHIFAGWVSFPGAHYYSIHSFKYNFKDLTMEQRDAISRADFSWMKELAKYDHWDLYKSGPFANFTESEAINWNGSISEVPMPFLSGFSALATLRLLSVKSSADALEALNEVSHLAKLLYSTETMDGAKAAVDIYEMTDIFHGKFVKLGFMRAKDFTRLSSGVLFKAKRAIDAAPVFVSYNVTSDPEIFKKVFDRPSLPPGTCAAFLKTVNIDRLKKTSWYTWDNPSEDDYAQNNAKLVSRLKTSCRLSYYRPEVTAEQWATNLRAIEIPKHDVIEDIKIGNWDIWRYWYVMKVALKIPHVRNTYTRYVASDNYPYFSSEYRDWDKFSKNFENKGKNQ